jgi:hypothetical protein
MCEYSLHAIASRSAKAAETLVSTEFLGTSTRGFASADAPAVAVCLLPGTELAFAKDVCVRGIIFKRKVNDRMARFRHLHNDPSKHHDALETA